MNISVKFYVVISLAVFFNNATIAQETIKPFTIGESISWQSKTLRQERSINVYLPHGYHQNTSQKYPVIYLLDGSTDEDFIHIAGLVQFGSFSWINMLEESIVVGIVNIDRKHDMTYPTSVEADKKEFPTTGGSEKFIDFIGTELQPMISKRYRTKNTKTLIGQSLGGLLATEILFKQTDMFDNYLIVSPSLWWDEGSILKLKDGLNLSGKSIFVAVGKEGPIMEKAAADLYAKIQQLHTTNARIKYEYFADLDHGNTLHQAAYSGFNFIFATQETKNKPSIQ